MGDETREPRETPPDGGGAGGGYTARPSKEPPAEGTTRDEDQEAKERTGTDQGSSDSGTRCVGSDRARHGVDDTVKGTRR